uniref:Uncharacterized protein n=1 Tax=Marseillevirus LCMAC103 TaxID=2506604 RepID=A0A481YX46_9VIRU|nr:MAG: hypothetical protein LCMAC103_04400 [Marseillevirus LCMAC103]
MSQFLRLCTFSNVVSAAAILISCGSIRKSCEARALMKQTEDNNLKLRKRRLREDRCAHQRRQIKAAEYRKLNVVGGGRKKRRGKMTWEVRCVDGDKLKGIFTTADGAVRAAASLSGGAMWYVADRAVGSHFVPVFATTAGPQYYICRALASDSDDAKAPILDQTSAGETPPGCQRHGVSAATSTPILDQLSAPMKKYLLREGAKRHAPLPQDFKVVFPPLKMTFSEA